VSTYLWVNLGAIAIPLAFSFHRRLRFDRTWFALWPALLGTAAVFIAWDVLYTHWGVWGFNPLHLTGHEWLGLPVEEWLFFICIPYACLFTYHWLGYAIERDWLGGAVGTISRGLSLALLALAAIFFDRIYTSVTCAGTAVLLLAHLHWIRSLYLGRFFLAYIVILLPFLLVNGILTGSWIEEEVVWYDDGENLNLRVMTIPVEDFIYAMLLLLVNVTLFEALKSRRRKGADVAGD